MWESGLHASVKKLSLYNMRIVFYRLGWSLEHPATKTHIEMLSIVKAIDGVANGDMDFTYMKNSGKLEKMSMQGEADMNKMKTFVKV